MNNLLAIVTAMTFSASSVMHALAFIGAWLVVALCLALLVGAFFRAGKGSDCPRTDIYSSVAVDDKTRNVFQGYNCQSDCSLVNHNRKMHKRLAELNRVLDERDRELETVCLDCKEKHNQMALSFVLTEFIFDMSEVGLEADVNYAKAELADILITKLQEIS